MNEDINLVEILKDCPKGTKFYSTVYGNITLDFIDINNLFIFCIHMIEDDGTPISFTKEGKIYNIEDGECVIFPSKDQRDWNVWKKVQDQKFEDIKTEMSISEIEKRLGLTSGSLRIKK